MNRFLGLAVIAVAVFQFNGVAYAQEASDMDARIEAATAYEKVVPVESMINEMLNEIKKNPQMAIMPADLEVIRNSYDMPELRAKLIDTMAKHFTVEELNALAEFYGKPEGRSVMKKMPAYMSDFMPYIQSQMIKGIQQVMQSRAASAAAAAPKQ